MGANAEQLNILKIPITWDEHDLLFKGHDLKKEVSFMKGNCGVTIRAEHHKTNENDNCGHYEKKGKKFTIILSMKGLKDPMARRLEGSILTTTRNKSKYVFFQVDIGEPAD